MSILLWVMIAVFAAFGIWVGIRVYRKQGEIGQINDGLVRDIGLNLIYAVFRWFSREPVTQPEIVSTVPVPAEAVAAVTAGLKKALRIIKYHRPDWDIYDDPGDFDIVFIDPPFVSDTQASGNVLGGPRLTNRDGSPAIRVMGWQAAGTILGGSSLPSTDRPYIVVPHQAFHGWAHLGYLENTAWYEAEHVMQRLHNYAEFRQHEGYHTHPIYRDPAVPQTLADQKDLQFVCGLGVTGEK